MVPENPDALLTRTQTGEALRAVGFPVADKSLATRASRGGGPPYRHFGARVLYRWGDALGWAQAQLSEPISSTSETDAAGLVASPRRSSSDRSQASSTAEQKKPRLRRSLVARPPKPCTPD
jgi:hypothetical protein